MIPKYLKINNFMSHKKSEIDFSKLPNATIIIGMEDGSFKASNAVGKTTLFNAIYFSLFDMTVGKKSRVIRDGEKKCEVEFIFETSKGLYKIFRTRTKTTKNVYFYRYNDTWEDISEKTSSQTEKKICDMLGISQKMFEKSSYFKQDDKFDLASATPEKRKAIIMDMLHLKKWGLYEKQAKLKKAIIEKDVEVLQKTISIIDDPKKIIIEKEKILKNIIINLNSIQKENEKIKESLIDKRKDLTNLETKNSTNVKELENKLNNEYKYLNLIYNDIKQTKKEIDINKEKLKNISQMFAENQKKLDDYKVEYEHISSNYPEEIPDKIYNNLNDEIINYNNIIKSKESMFKLLAKDVPDDDFCPTCLTELNEENKKDIIKSKQKKLDILSLEIKEAKNNREDLVNKKNKYDLKINEYRKYIIYKDNCEKNIKELNGFIKNVNEQIDYKNKTLYSLNEELKSKENISKKSEQIIINIKKEIDSSNTTNYDKEINELKKEIKNIENVLLKNNNMIMEEFYSKGAYEKVIEGAKADIKKINNMIKDLKNKEDDLLVYKAVTNAFSSYGIPAMIISTVLDSLQCEINEVLKILRPGIQIQFYLEKERSDGKQEDTLGMKFFVNSVEWDYEELSGGQRACISLALKFAISVINRKRCGADIRILLLDECEQALDKQGIESFYKVVKKWSKDMVILIITHNEQLKEMFDSFILVSKDNNITTAKVVE